MLQNKELESMSPEEQFQLALDQMMKKNLKILRLP